MNRNNPNSISRLSDICTILIAPSLPKEERVVEFLNQIKNPYHFKCGGIEVHICYSSEGPSLSDCLKQLID